MISESIQLVRLRRAWGVTLLGLMAATYPLWTPLSDAPRLPLPGLLSWLPPAFDWVLVGALGLATLSAAFVVRSAERRVGWATLLLVLLLVGDQLRWQPWAYHALLVGGVLACCPPRLGLRLMRYLAISVYIYSAWSKCDYTFVTTLGQQFLATLVGWFGSDLTAWPEEMRHALALAFPLFEAAAGGLFLLGLWRTSFAKWGVGLALTMHAGLLLVLSPLGLGHSLGVLLWNVGFAWQTYLLFWRIEPTTEPFKNTWGSRLAIVAILFAVVAPLSYPWGLWDRWPSWGLYAPSGERAAVFVHQGVWERLPVALREVSDQAADNPWRRIRLDRWLLAENRAPIYPQNRIAIALAAELAEGNPLGDRVRVIAEGHASRLHGRRTSTTLDGAASLKQAASWWGGEQPVVWP